MNTELPPPDPRLRVPTIEERFAERVAFPWWVIVGMIVVILGLISLDAWVR